MKFNPKEYEYIGPEEIFKMIQEKHKGQRIESVDDLVNWILENNGKPKTDDLIICTFVINLEGKLLIADRHTEHVQCANGENVRSAGEMGFYLDNQNKVTIEFVSNQSTGYCPSSASWLEVEHSILKINGLNIPEGFDPEFIFSYCPNCKTRQIVKDEFYFCPKCEERLLNEDDFQRQRKNLEFK